jgi:catechol 2,3-dioxygenase-like lactoylglutathione lyase family enzyme
MDAEGTFRRIDHVGVVVRDIELTRAAYVRDLGLEPDGEEVVGSVNVRLAYLKCRGDRDPAYLQLVQPLGPGPVADFLAEHGEGLHHVCFGVPDISRALRQIDGGSRHGGLPGRQGTCRLFPRHPPGQRADRADADRLARRGTRGGLKVTRQDPVPGHADFYLLSR